MPKSVTLYGLATCDTCRKARAWLDQHKVGHSFHDVRAHGVTKPQVEAWVKALGWEKVFNKASTTWRELPEAEKGILDEKKAVALMLKHPALIKRPVLDVGGKLHLGFKPDAYASIF